jgi:hypothetical protein
MEFLGLAYWISTPRRYSTGFRDVSILWHGYKIFAQFGFQVAGANSSISLIGSAQSGFLQATEKRFSYAGGLADVVEFGVHLVSIGSEGWGKSRKLNITLSKSLSQ